ncbi:MAG: hypothetical protein LBJ60_01805 [Tannerellaceae bacterium]|jgi:hypothetical protein|nr:hypothetical protein [Tannerellaceae bacterium]
MRTFHHLGIITHEKKEGAMYNETLSVWLTDPGESLNKIEWLKFEEGSILSELIQKETHVAYTVPSIDEELKGKNVLFPPMVCNECLTIAFIEEEGIPVEIMEVK